MNVLLNRKAHIVRRPKITQLEDTSFESLLTLLNIEHDKDGEFDRDALAKTLHQLLHDNDTLCDQVDHHEEEMQRLISFMDDTENRIHEIEYSKAWKFGFLCLRFAKKCLGRPTYESGFKKINETFSLFHHWKKARG